MLRPALSPPAAPNRLPLWLVGALPFLLALMLLPWVAFTDEAVSLDSSIRSLRAAVATMKTSLEPLPEHEQGDAVTEVHVLAQAIERGLLAIESQRVQPVDPALSHDLGYVNDVVQAIGAEVEGAVASEGAPAVQLIERVGPLIQAAGHRLAAIERKVELWAAKTRDAVVELEDDGGRVVVKWTDRLLYDGIRYTGVALFLIGLLVVGLRLLTLGETDLSVADLIRQAPVGSALGLAALAVFLLGSLLLSVRPSLFVTPSARAAVVVAGHPCSALAYQRGDLAAATQVGSHTLVAAVKARMRPAVQACLGLGSETAALEVVERLALRAADHERGGEEAAAGMSVAGTEATSQIQNEIDRLMVAIRGLLPTPEPGREDAEVRAITTPATDAHGPDPARPVRINGSVDREQAVPDDAQVSAPMPPRPAPRGFVTTERVNFRDGPSLGAQRLGTLGQGTRVLFLGQADGWARVQLDDGRAVYVAADFLQPAG